MQNTVHIHKITSNKTDNSRTTRFTGID